MAFFGIISLIFFIASMIFGIPVFIEFFQTKMVARFPTLIFSGFLLMISVLSLICGIILDVVARKYRQTFELTLLHEKSNEN